MRELGAAMGSEQCREKAQQGWEYGGTSAGWRRERQGCGLGGGSGEQRESLLDGGFLNICHPLRRLWSPKPLDSGGTHPRGLTCPLDGAWPTLGLRTFLRDTLPSSGLPRAASEL